MLGRVVVMLPLDDLADGKTVDVTQEFSLGSGTIKCVRQSSSPANHNNLSPSLTSLMDCFDCAAGTRCP